MNNSFLYAQAFNRDSFQKRNNELFISVLEQLRFLWSHQFISVLCSFNLPVTEQVTSYNKDSLKSTVKFFFEKITSKQENLLNQQEAVIIYKISSFYRQILMLMNEPKIDILSGFKLFSTSWLLLF
jgi:hypothetical protein